jgi:hypothetical protein
MISKIRFPLIAHDVGWLGTLAPLFVLALCGTAWGVCPATPNYQDIDIQCKNHTQADAIYDNPPGTAITDTIALCPAPPATTTSVTWRFTASNNCTTPLTGPVTCSDGTNNMVLTAPSPPGLAPSTFSGKVPSGLGTFSVTATDAANSTINCTRTYRFNLLGTTGGWGDPHILRVDAVDGVHYDFQSAGEFTALRGDGLEIQTRQTPVATTFLPGANPYTGLPTCVALYSAVAVRVGKHRVSYEPNISGVPDPSGLQLRVDGVLRTLGPQGIDLEAGRIVQPWGGVGIEIDYSDKTTLIVTPDYWTDQQKWYLNVNVYGTKATKGIFGNLAKGIEGESSWLPALPDGTSLGPKPESLHQRYVDLYEKFADAWRVTDATSLFDYRPGTSTATFTLGEWPRDNPKSCAIPEQPSAEPVDVSVAEKACSAVVDKNMRADCVFDVSVTGFLGFAETYLLTQQRQPGATKSTVKGDRDISTSGENVTFTATVAEIAPKGGGGAPAGTVQFILDGGNVGNPVTLDPSSRALWSTASLPVGQHQIVAEYTPTGWGGFLASRSPEKSHMVIATSDLYWWLVILLIIIILIALLIWRYPRTH